MTKGYSDVSSSCGENASSRLWLAAMCRMAWWMPPLLKMQRRLAGIADGWVGPGGAPADNFVAGVRRVREFAQEQGRDPNSLGFGKLINVSIDPSRERAFELARAHWNTYYGPNFNVERSAICGEPDEVGAALREFGEAETPEVTLIIEQSNLDLEQLHLLAETMGVTPV